MVIDWVEIVENKHHTFMTGEDTYPKEGYTVLISDGTNYDIAYYVCSGSYKWLKINIVDDNAYDFVDFVPTRWSYIDE